MRKRAARLAAAVILAAGALGVASAAPEADVALLGASGRLGLGGGWWPGSWAALRLESSVPGEHRLTLATEEGTLRSGLIPVTAELVVPDGPGTRSAELDVPMFGQRPARLTLEGPAGSRTVMLQPFDETPRLVVTDRPAAAVNGLALRPEDLGGPAARWLSGGIMLVERAGLAPSVSSALSLVAGGVRLVPPAGAGSTLGRLPPGPIGLGAVGPGEVPTVLRLEEIARLLAPDVGQPGRTHGRLAWWVAGALAAVLGAYSARRLAPAAAHAAGASAVLLGAFGAWALSPTAPEDREARLLVGAGGWGIETTLGARMRLTAGEVVLAPGARPLSRVAQAHHAGGTRVAAAAWSVTSDWTPPRAVVVPLRVTAAGSLVNSGRDRLDSVAVVGSGQQEPLPAGVTRPVIRAMSSLPYPIQPLEELLPPGSAVARNAAGDWLIALPEGS